MSIAEKITALSNAKTSIANAIVAKGVPGAGSHGFSSFATDIAAIPTGGVTPTGTINISANGSYDITNYATAAVNVSGGAEIPTYSYVGDGNLHIYLYIKNYLSPCICFGLNGSATVDWGDGTATDRISSTTIDYLQTARHTYEKNGFYHVSISYGSGTQIKIFSIYTTSSFVWKNVATFAIDATYCNSVRCIELGKNIELGEKAFLYMTSLEKIYINSNVSAIKINDFNYCYSMADIYFLNSTPPSFESSKLWDYFPDGCKVHVPKGSLYAYQTATNKPNPSKFTYVEED